MSVVQPVSAAHLRQPFKPVHSLQATRRVHTSCWCQHTANASKAQANAITCDPQPAAASRRAATLSVVLTPLLSQLALTSSAQAKPTAGDWTSPGLATPVDDSAPKFFKTDSGVKIQELSKGSGPVAQTGDTVLFDYVLRRSNGYFIYGTIEGVSFQPKDVPVAPVSIKLGEGLLIPGLEEVLVGMQPGGQRRALIPPSVGYQDPNTQLPQPPTFATKRQLVNHYKEPLLFEVQMLRVGGKK